MCALKLTNHAFRSGSPSPASLATCQALKHRMTKLEAENCALKEELDKLHCVSRLRYRQVQHLENVVQKLCEASGIDWTDQNYSDPEYFSRTFFTLIAPLTISFAIFGPLIGAPKPQNRSILPLTQILLQKKKNFCPPFLLCSLLFALGTALNRFYAS